jgi:hypothetical protein
MQIIKLSEIYKLIHDDLNTSIRVEIEGATMTIHTAQNGCDFTFVDSKPEMVRKIGELLIQASELCPEKDMKTCKHCGGNLEIRNPTGNCDHLYYPENCEICRLAGYKMGAIS